MSNYHSALHFSFEFNSLQLLTVEIDQNNKYITKSCISLLNIKSKVLLQMYLLMRWMELYFYLVYVIIDDY